jgi:hypothetical protein
MTSTTRVRLTLDGGEHDVPAEELEPKVSPITGSELRRVQATLTAQGDQAHEGLHAILRPDSGEEVVLSEPGGRAWVVSDHSYSYRQGAGRNTLYVHTFELQEREELRIEAVEFGALALTPERWALNEKTPVTFEFLATLDADQHQQFEQFRRQADNSYFPVTWGGTSHHPLSARFGRCLWEAADDGGARNLIMLVGQDGDTQQAGLDQLFDPWKWRLIEEAVRVRSGFDALVGELEQAGVLGAEAISRIKDSVANPDEARLREFDRVYKIEDYFA